jgi:hypothetical protein
MTCLACGMTMTKPGLCPHCDQPCHTASHCPECRRIDRYMGTGPATIRP